MLRTASVVSFFLLTAAIAAQSNTIPGMDGRLTNNAGPQYFGRRGAVYPNGEISMSYSYTMCNPGTVPMPWSAPMNPLHPMFAFMVVRESNGRMEQITNSATTYVKHAFAAANGSSTCGTCQSTGSGLRVGCSDAYGASTNASQYYLGPASEIDPWTGVWTPLGSYFDRGDPDVGPPANMDGVRSLTSTQASALGPVKNRVTLFEQDLLVPGRLFHCMHIVVTGEDGDLHFDNIGHRQVTATWNGTTWTFLNTGVPFTQGTVLNQWAGATVDSARNGEDDGHFIVAVKVTPNGNGTWHYEYAVQNFDNNRGGASLRVPVWQGSAVTNVGFRDIDGDSLNDWTWSHVGGQLSFSASATNPLNWNNIYNFWFDCDVAPVNGTVAIDQARLGPGGLTVAVNAQIPGIAEVESLGPGCGSPVPAVAANGLPTIPNPAFGLTVTGSPSAPVLLFNAIGSVNVPITPGCIQYLASSTLITHGFYFANGSGLVSVPVPIPGILALEGLTVFWQSAEVQSGGPVFGSFAISNGLATRLGGR